MLFERIKNIIRASLGDAFSSSSDDSTINIEEIEKEYEKIKKEREAAERKNQEQQQRYYQTNAQLEKERQYYADLELPYGASFDEIKKAYRRLVKQFHPDKYANDRQRYETAVRLTSKLNEAYAYFENKYQKS